MLEYLCSFEFCSSLSLTSMSRIVLCFSVVCLLSSLEVGFGGLPSLLGLQPGPAEGSESSATSGEWSFVLQNSVLEALITCRDGILQPIQLTNKISGQQLPPPEDAFQANLVLDGRLDRAGEVLSSSDFQVLTMNLGRVENQANASQLSLRMTGWMITAVMELRGTVESAKWSIELRDGSNYLKIALRMSGPADNTSSGLADGEVKRSGKHPVDPEADSELCLLSGNLQGSRVAGKVDGVPVISDHFFFGLEHPQAQNSADRGKYRCCLKQHAEKIAEHGPHADLVLGVAAPGQMRRSFLYYLERERAHPSRKMLHYNSWYDIGTGQQFDAKQAVDRLEHIARELARRGVVLDSFLMDSWQNRQAGHSSSQQEFDAGRQCLTLFLSSDRTDAELEHALIFCLCKCRCAPVCFAVQG